MTVKLRQQVISKTCLGHSYPQGVLHKLHIWTVVLMKPLTGSTNGDVNLQSTRSTRNTGLPPLVLLHQLVAHEFDPFD